MALKPPSARWPPPPLIVRRRWPVTVLLVVAAVYVAAALADVAFTPFVSNAGPNLAIAAFTAAGLSPRLVVSDSGRRGLAPPPGPRSRSRSICTRTTTRMRSSWSR